MSDNFMSMSICPDYEDFKKVLIHPSKPKEKIFTVLFKTVSGSYHTLSAQTWFDGDEWTIDLNHCCYNFNYSDFEKYLILKSENNQ